MLDTPKTKASKRKIPMLSQAYDILSEKKRQADSVGIGNEDNFIFCLPDGAEQRTETDRTFYLPYIETRICNKGNRKWYETTGA